MIFAGVRHIPRQLYLVVILLSGQRLQTTWTLPASRKSELNPKTKRELKTRRPLILPMRTRPGTKSFLMCCYTKRPAAELPPVNRAPNNSAKRYAAQSAPAGVRIV